MNQVPNWDAGYYPDIKTASKIQKEFYKKLKIELDKGNYLNLDTSISYLFVYIYKCIEQFEKNKNIKTLEKKLLNIEKNYKDDFPKISHYIFSWLGDAFYYLEEYDLAWHYQRKRVYREWSTKLVDFINIECRNQNYELNSNIIEEIFTFSNSLTKFGISNLEAIKKTIDKSLNEFHHKHKQNILYYYLEQFKIKKRQNVEVLFRGIIDVKLTAIVPFKHQKKNYIPVKEQIDQFVRDCENRYRVENNLPKIGEGWISETVLYYQIKELFSKYKVEPHAKTEFLRLQHLDIYIPELQIAIEYQGEQHSKPVTKFGGKEAFELTQERDLRKKELCEQNNINLLYVYPEYELKDVVNELLLEVNKKGIDIEFDNSKLDNPSLYQIRNELKNREELSVHSNNNQTDNQKLPQKENSVPAPINKEFDRNIKTLNEKLSKSITVLDKVFFSKMILDEYYRNCYKNKVWTKEMEEFGLEFIGDYSSIVQSILSFDSIEKYEVSFEEIQWLAHDLKVKVSFQCDNQNKIFSEWCFYYNHVWNQQIPQVDIDKEIVKEIIDTYLFTRPFESMAKMYTYNEEYEKALDISNIALSHGIKGSGKTGFKGRIQSLEKKIIKRNSHK
ncbi:hypothetical protein [Peribacillus asahii]|uniref:hypothetical protein n=1 Tax=Peribacillus asahii TaxID=228899 RepID=UPI003806D967